MHSYHCGPFGGVRGGLSQLWDLIFSRACHSYAPGLLRVHFDDDNDNDDEHDGEDQNGHNLDNF